MKNSASNIPYYGQWESSERAAQILAGELALADDPKWAQSGAASTAEYVLWANHICGMACLKMILAARTGEQFPTLVLARQATAFGAYTVDGADIRGLVYAPFVAMIKARFGIEAEVRTALTAFDLPALVQQGELFMASVHPTIRHPALAPPGKGGHLVLVTQADDTGLCFHNPSGHDEASQSDVRLDLACFDRFFAGRGVRVLPA